MPALLTLRLIKWTGQKWDPVNINRELRKLLNEELNLMKLCFFTSLSIAHIAGMMISEQ